MSNKEWSKLIDAIYDFENVKFGDWVEEVGYLNSFYAYRLFQHMSKAFLKEIKKLEKKNDLRIIWEMAQDDANWRGAITTALVGPESEEISRGRALEIIAELKNGKVVE